MAARCQALSYAASVEDYTLHDDGRATFYARITKATLTEISLTENPSNPNALVTRRGPPPPGVALYNLMQAKVACLQKMVPILCAPIRAAQARDLRRQPHRSDQWLNNSMHNMEYDT